MPRRTRQVRTMDDLDPRLNDNTKEAIRQMVIRDAIISYSIFKQQFGSGWPYNQYMTAKRTFKKYGNTLRATLLKKEEEAARQEEAKLAEAKKREEEAEKEKARKQAEIERAKQEAVKEYKQDIGSFSFDELIEETANKLANAVANTFARRLKPHIRNKIREATVNGASEVRSYERSIADHIEKRKILVTGPLKYQFDDVINSLPAEIKHCNQFIYLDKSSTSSKIPQADIYIIWVKFINHSLQNKITNSASNKDKVILTNSFSAKSLSMDLIKAITDE